MKICKHLKTQNKQIFYKPPWTEGKRKITRDEILDELYYFFGEAERVNRLIEIEKSIESNSGIIENNK